MPGAVDTTAVRGGGSSSMRNLSGSGTEVGYMEEGQPGG